jgi:NodT family efflux transporter outer membrane factor (OMF) lipoprotein
MRMMALRGIALAAGVALVAACAAGPDYRRPAAPVPAAYREQAGWKAGEPAAAEERAAQWSAFGDPQLDALEARVAVSNQNLIAAEAAWREATATLQGARAGFLPTVSAGAGATRSGRDGAWMGTDGHGGGHAGNQFSLDASASWSLDLWGRVRRQVEGDTAAAQASAADLAGARLSAQAALAADYFALRASDAQQRMLQATIADDQRALEITQHEHDAGVVSNADVLQAQAQLAQAQAAAIGTGVQRARLEHAMAVLLGVPPAEFRLAPAPARDGQPVYELPAPPEIPVALPSRLLERRPDIAAAERRMAAANAQVGVAAAAYYPDLTLSASYGYSSSALDTLFRAPTALWSLGPQLAETVFDGGLRDAQAAQARAGWDAAVAQYRATVLAAFQQVEDGLSDLRILDEQERAEDRAVAAAEAAEQLIVNQYRAGTVGYASVITAMNDALSSRQAALSVRAQRLASAVALVEALGGGWDASQPGALDPRSATAAEMGPATAAAVGPATGAARAP